MSNYIFQIQQQAIELLTLKQTLNSLSTGSGSGSGTGGGNNLAIQQQLNTFQSKTQGRLNSTEKALNQVQTMVQTLLGQVTALLTKPGSG